MKGPTKILNQDERADLYFKLQRPQAVSPGVLALSIEQVRFDARLAECVCEHIRDFWTDLDPNILHCELTKIIWPETVLPMLEEIRMRCEGTPEEHLEFLKWSNIVAFGFKNDSRQFFYIDNWLPDHPHFHENIHSSRPWFIKHNYYCKETFFNKDIPKSLSWRKK